MPLPAGVPARALRDALRAQHAAHLLGLAFELGAAASDFNTDGFVSGDDFDAFVAAFELGC